MQDQKGNLQGREEKVDIMETPVPTFSDIRDKCENMAVDENN
jgi:hypothetical protein